MRILNVRAWGLLSGRSWAALLLMAVLAASSVLFRPGIAMTDTMARWTQVFILSKQLSIPWAAEAMEQWLAPAMSIFMLPIGLLGLPTAAFTLMQVGYLAVAGLAWLAMTSGKYPFWIPLTFALPLVFLYVCFVVPDVWTLAAILLVIASVLNGEQRQRWLFLTLFLISSVVLFGFRQNSLVVFPAIVAMILTRKTMPRATKGLYLALLCTSLVLVQAAPGALGFGKRTSVAAAPAWELVGMLRIAQESGIPVDPALTLTGIADTGAAIKQHSFSTIDTLLWSEVAALPAPTVLNRAQELTSRWLRLAMYSPSLYVRMKMRTYECVVGLCEHYLQTQVWDVKPWPTLIGLVDSYSERRPNGGFAYEQANRFGKMFEQILLPVFWLPASLFVFFVSWRQYGPYDRWLIAVTSAYLASFFILNQAASFRYMFPVYVVFTAYQFRFVGGMWSAGWRRLTARRKCCELGLKA